MEISKWEYKRIAWDNEKLAELGKQGWECFGFQDNTVALKRPCGRLQVIEKVNGVPINQDKDRSDGVER